MSERRPKIAKVDQTATNAVNTNMSENQIVKYQPLKLDQLTLFGDHIDAATQSILMLLDELALKYQFVEVDTRAEVHLTAAFKKFSLHHRIPCLLHGTLRILESNTIIFYIMENFGAHSTLYSPSNRLQHYQILDRMFYNANVLNRLSEDMFDEVRTKGTSDLRHYGQRADDAWTTLETLLSEQRFMASKEDVTIADLVILGTMTAICVVFKVHIDIRWPGIVIWYERMIRRPSFQRAMQPAANRFRDYIKSIVRLLRKLQTRDIFSGTMVRMHTTINSIISLDLVHDNTMPLQNFSQDLRKNWPHRFVDPRKSQVPNGKEWPYRTAPMETIDRMMEIQHALFELAQITNAYYRMQMLILILTAFMMIVFDCYGILDLLYNQFKKFQVNRDEGILLLGYQIIVNVLNVMGLVVTCSLLRTSVRQTADIAHKVMIVSTSNDIRDRMMQFSMQIQRSMPTFTAFEMFEIDATLIYAIVGATTTYLIILVQYSNNNPDVSQHTLQQINTHHE